MATQPHKYGFTQAGLRLPQNRLDRDGSSVQQAAATVPLTLGPSPSQFMFVYPSQATYKALAHQIIKAHISQVIHN
ncbi:hypothetical protein BRADI_5g23525v3 [Brachypodium distachyon]|uniref:Uncharacterized protein n=1 Tax=Brachypodium distachyon TaxID=15368 RepID=I1J2F4_BRADI|nr:hypothetical protein BRADI_5g23525v3 [Brachypodium distachyon]